MINSNQHDKAENRSGKKTMGEIKDAVQAQVDKYKDKKVHTSTEKRQNKDAVFFLDFFKKKTEQDPQFSEQEISPKYIKGANKIYLNPIYFINTKEEVNGVFKFFAVMMKEDGESLVDYFSASKKAMGRLSLCLTEKAPEEHEKGGGADDKDDWEH